MDACSNGGGMSTAKRDLAAHLVRRFGPVARPHDLNHVMHSMPVPGYVSRCKAGQREHQRRGCACSPFVYWCLLHRLAAL